MSTSNVTENFFEIFLSEFIDIAIKYNSYNIDDLILADKKLFANYLKFTKVNFIDLNELQKLVKVYFFKNDIIKIDINISFFN